MDTCSKRWVCNCSNAHFIDICCFSLGTVIYFLWPALHSLELFIRFLISCRRGVQRSTEFTAVVVFPILVDVLQQLSLRSHPFHMAASTASRLAAALPG